MTNEPPAAATEPRSPAVLREQTARRSPWLVLFAFVLAAVLLYFTLRGLDWSTFWRTIRTGHYEFLLITVPIACVNYFIRAVRWSILVRSEGRVPVRTVFWANMLGYMGNAYLPARAGELARSAFLGRRSGLGTSFILATALTERLLDVIALVLLGSTALLLQAKMSPPVVSALRLLALAGFLGLVVVIVAPFQEKLILQIAGWIPLPDRFSRILNEQITRFLLGMRSLENGRRLVAFIGLTLVIWLVDALANVTGVQIISQALTIAQALILLAALGLSSAVPSTPGYVGVYQFVAVTVLTPFGFTRAEALAYILISQTLNYIIVTVLGLLGLWQAGRIK